MCQERGVSLCLEKSLSLSLIFKVHLASSVIVCLQIDKRAPRQLTGTPMEALSHLDQTVTVWSIFEKQFQILPKSSASHRNLHNALWILS